jgi:hypothetical protein
MSPDSHQQIWPRARGCGRDDGPHDAPGAGQREEVLYGVLLAPLEEQRRPEIRLPHVKPRAHLAARDGRPTEATAHELHDRGGGG